VPINNATLGKEVQIRQPDLVNLYGCTIGDGTRIGAFVEVQKNAVIGARCKISSHTFICEGVTIEDECFVGQLQTEDDWKVDHIRVCHGASIGSGAVIMCGVTIGERALVGAGAVVTRDVPKHSIVAGVPAKVVRSLSELEISPFLTPQCGLSEDTRQ